MPTPSKIEDEPVVDEEEEPPIIKKQIKCGDLRASHDNRSFFDKLQDQMAK